MDSSKELFLKYDYAEAKDMGIHFLTLVTAVLVFSLNFAEKAFNFQAASKKKRLIIILGWCSFFIAIILCGTGVAFNALAGGSAVRNNDTYLQYSSIADRLLILAGFSFIIGLLFSIISAIVSRTIIANNK